MLQTFVKATTTTASSTTEIAGLTVVTGFPEFADAFADKQLVRYTILDVDDKPLAEEIGEYVSATDKLTRHTCLKSWVSDTTYDDTSPSKISLTSSTEYHIVCTPGDSAFHPTLHNIDDTSSGVSRFHVSSHSSLRRGDNKTLSAGTVYYVPMLLDADMTINSFGVFLGTAAASSTIKIGIYSIDKDGYIGDKLLETTSTIDTSTGAPAVVSGACTATHLPAGWYATAVMSDGGNPVLYAYPANKGGRLTPFGLNTSWYTITFRTEAPGSYALPATANATTSGSADNADYAPVIGLGY